MKVMTPLLGTKTPSAPVGDKSSGERRAARAAAFQVFTKHETRDPRHGYCLARGASQREFRGFHATRITAFFRNTSLTALRCAVRRKSGAEGGRTKNRNPTLTPPCPLSSHGLPARHWTRLAGFFVARSRLPRRLFPTISRYFPSFLGGWGSAPEQVFKRCSLEIPEKCTKSRFSQENA